MLPLIWGTFLITGIALLVAVPLGLGAAIYLSEYARPRVRKTLKPALEMLAGVPTIVFGYFALTFFTPEILQGVFGTDGIQIFNAWSAGIIMGFMIIPTIASLAEDAMSAVPQSLREGAFGLGASKLQVSLRVVFPAALSGIVAAIVLGISRAVGETMIVLVAAGLVANNALNPGRAPRHHDRVHRSHRQGRHRHGQHRLQDGLRGRRDAVRDHVRHEHDLDPLRAQVQAGVRVSARRIAQRQAQGPARSGRPCSPASASRSRCSLVLLVDVAADGLGAISWDFLCELRVLATPTRRASAPPCSGTIWLMGVCIVFIVPVGVATAVYLEEYADGTRWWNKLIEVNIQNLAAVPSIVYGILGPGVPGARAARLRATWSWPAA